MTTAIIQWDRVDCLQRNGEIDQYKVVYYPIFDSSNRTSTTVIGNSKSDRMFTAVGLQPRTNYTFEVEAFNSGHFQRSPPAILSVSTSAPQGECASIMRYVIIIIITTPIEVGLLLQGYLYSNNSIVTLSDIGEDSFSLLCYTNNTQCCRYRYYPSARYTIREWYFPNGTNVNVKGAQGDFYRTRGSSVVRLNRRNSTMIPTGVFRCEIPDANETNRSIYVGVYPQEDGKINVYVFHTVYIVAAYPSIQALPPSYQWH